MFEGHKRKYCSHGCRHANAPRTEYSRNCVWCGNPFLCKRAKQKTCSVSCAQQVRRNKDGKRCLCQQCGTWYRPKQYDRVKFCSRECSFSHLWEQSRYREGMLKWWRAHVVQVVVRKPCKECGEDVRQGGKTAYCSDECRRLWSDKSSRRYRKYPTGCKHCGAATAFYHHKCDDCVAKNVRACRRASKARRRARLRGALVCERFDSHEVFRRDGYRCQMCGVKTRPMFKTTHRLYPELDHIVPSAHDGDHSRLNTQCLCRGCNQKKSDSLGGQQLRLIG